MKTISRILVAILILSVMIQTISASDAQDYKCVDKISDKTPPQMSSSIKVDESIEKVPLCSEGKVPVSTVALKTSDVGISDKDMSAKESPEATFCKYGICYDWVTSRQYVNSIGISAYLTQHSPTIDPTNGLYSAANIYMTDGSNRVLVGWKKLNGGSTRLDTSWWRYNELQDCGYYGCDFVQVSSYYYPGMYLGDNTYGVKYEIQYSGGNWWLAYNGEWLGYYPGSLWSYGFSYTNENVYRGAVASTVTTTTTDMGNGLWSSDPYAANIHGQSYLDQYYNWYSAYTTKGATSPSLYSVTNTGSDSMRYGGPGSSGSSITVTTPNGGENWARGSSKRIQWSYTGSPGSRVRIDLLKGGSLNSVVTYDTYNDGSFDWSIPSGQMLGNDYRIKVTSTSNSAYTDTSNSNFAISSGAGSASIRVIAPNGGENWPRGSNKLITWTKTGNPGANVRIQLYKGSTFIKTISPNTPNDGSFNWNIPWTIAIRNDYKIKITSTTNGAYNDWSNNNFRIS